MIVCTGGKEIKIFVGKIWSNTCIQQFEILSPTDFCDCYERKEILGVDIDLSCKFFICHRWDEGREGKG